MKKPKAPAKESPLITEVVVVPKGTPTVKVSQAKLRWSAVRRNSLMNKIYGRETSK